MSIGRVCTRRMATLEDDGSLEAAAVLMARMGVDTLVVVDRKGRALGVVTDRDLVVRGMARGLPPRETSVSEIMTTPLPSDLRGQVLAYEGDPSEQRPPVLLRDTYETLPSLLALDDALHLVDRELGRRGGRDSSTRDDGLGFPDNGPDGGFDGRRDGGRDPGRDGGVERPRDPWTPAHGPEYRAEGRAEGRGEGRREDTPLRPEERNDFAPRPQGGSGVRERRRRPRTRPRSGEATEWE